MLVSFPFFCLFRFFFVSWQQPVESSVFFSYENDQNSEIRDKMLMNHFQKRFIDVFVIHARKKKNPTIVDRYDFVQVNYGPEFILHRDLRMHVCVFWCVASYSSRVKAIQSSRLKRNGSFSRRLAVMSFESFVGSENPNTKYRAMNNPS